MPNSESQARQHFKAVFQKEVEEYLDSDKSLDLWNGKCSTIMEQGAVARILATNVEIKDWNGLLL